LREEGCAKGEGIWEKSVRTNRDQKYILQADYREGRWVWSGVREESALFYPFVIYGYVIWFETQRQ
jgi:hypothetical protein